MIHMEKTLQELLEDPDFVHTLDWSALPASLNELRAIIGAKAAIALAGAQGGNTVYIPAAPKKTHYLAELIGMEKTRELAQVYGGDRLSIPKLDAVLRQIRLGLIQQRRSQGASVPMLAAEFNLTRRRVHQILAATS